MAASDYDSSDNGSDSEPENVQQIVQQSETRLGQKKAERAAQQNKPSAKVKNLEKYNRRAPLSQKKIKVRFALAVVICAAHSCAVPIVKALMPLHHCCCCCYHRTFATRSSRAT